MTHPDGTRVAPVRRPREQARESYDRLAPVYDLIDSPFTRGHRRRALALLAVQQGERVLDIGCGTGLELAPIGRAVAADGTAIGLDLSERMLQIAAGRVSDPEIADRCRLVQGDAFHAPFADASMDAILMSFTLELFTLDDARVVLGQTHRMLRSGGRLLTVALATSPTPTLAQRLYLGVRRKLDRWLDCRPIPARELITDAGFEIVRAQRSSLWGLPVDTVVAIRR